MITRSTKIHLSKYVPKNEKDVLSLKYLCIVSITQMASHQGVDFFKSHALSGHSICTNQYRYLDQNILAPTFLCAYALTG